MLGGLCLLGFLATGRSPALLGALVLRGDRSIPGPHPAQWLSYAFVHLDAWHLLGNLLFLLLLGPPVTAALGARRFLGLYLGGVLGAALAFRALSSDALAGASGALAALTVAFLLRAPQGRRPGGLLLCAAKLLVIDSGLFAAATPAYEAHLGGALAGLLCCLWPRRSRG